MRAVSLAVVCSLTLAVAGGAHAQPGDGPGRPSHTNSVKGDPWERLNRRGFAINQALDKALVRPLSLLARGLTPGPIGKALHNFVNNLREPVVILNDILQIRPRQAVKSGVRLLINSTVGLLGVVDVANRIGVPDHPNGFGDTLGRYGVGPGPYIFLPLLGPSDVRDLFGAGADIVSTPLFYVGYPYKTEVGVTVAVVSGLDARAEADSDLETLLSDAADPYATLRSTYLQMRQSEINEGVTSTALPDLEDPAATPAPLPEAPSASMPEMAVSPAPGDGDGASESPDRPAP